MQNGIPVKAWAATSFATLAMTIPQQLHAQAAPAAVEAVPDTFDGITVTANKRTENLADIAGAIDVQTGDDLTAQNPTGLRDYVGNIPGVSPQPNGAPGFARAVLLGTHRAP